MAIVFIVEHFLTIKMLSTNNMIKFQSKLFVIIVADFIASLLSSASRILSCLSPNRVNLQDQSWGDKPLRCGGFSYDVSKWSVGLNRYMYIVGPNRN